MARCAERGVRCVNPAPRATCPVPIAMRRPLPSAILLAPLLLSPAAIRTAAAQSCTLAQEVVERMNAQRAKVDRRPLVVDARLTAAAQRHAADLAAGDLLEHAGSDGSTPAARVSEAGYGWTFVSENVAAGYATAEAVVQAWFLSPGHRENMMSPSPVHVGIGYAFRDSTKYQHYWTVNFGAGPADAEPVACM